MNKITAGVLLAYFALFIVPPVSSFAPGQTNPFAKKAMIEVSSGSNQQAARFLFDIIVWEQFNKTKQSEFRAAAHNDFFSSGPTGHLKYSQAAAVVVTTAFYGLMKPGTEVIPSHRSRSSAIRFSRSGSSPPLLLS